MKQLTILIASLFFLFTGMQAQDGTSLEEYRYLSKGFVYQLEMGLDANKEGYTIKNLYTTTNKTELIGLFANGVSKPRALLFVLNIEKEKPIYICVPSPNSNERVQTLYEIEQQKLNKLLFRNTFQIAMQEFLFQSLDGNTTSPSLTRIETKIERKAPIETPSNYEEEFTSKGNNIAPTATITEPTSKVARKKTISRSELQGALTGREMTQNPQPDGYSQKKGRVAIKICVNMDGEVISAKFTQRGSTTFNSYLKKIALQAAKDTKFTKNDIREQCGILNYTFNE